MAITAKNKTVKFEVIQTTSGVQFCTRCGGSGIEYERVYHGKTVKVNCTTCGGKGKETVEHETRVDLREAIAELFGLDEAQIPKLMAHSSKLKAKN